MPDNAIDNTNKMVSVCYRATFDNGTVFMEIPRDNPIRFPCCDGWMPPPIIDAVRTMARGETRSVRIGSHEANGIPEASTPRLFTLERSHFPDQHALEVDALVYLQDTLGGTYPARVVAITEHDVTFDASDKAIGAMVTFEIELLDVISLEEADTKRTLH